MGSASAEEAITDIASHGWLHRRFPGGLWEMQSNCSSPFSFMKSVMCVVVHIGFGREAEVRFSLNPPANYNSK